MNTKYIFAALALAAALLVSCNKNDKDEGLDGLKDNQVSWNGTIADITPGEFFDWECKSLGIKSGLDLGGAALSGATIDLANPKLPSGADYVRIAMMTDAGKDGSFQLELWLGKEGGDRDHLEYNLDNGEWKSGSCFKEGRFKGKYDDSKRTFRMEYEGTLLNGNTIAVKLVNSVNLE